MTTRHSNPRPAPVSSALAVVAACGVLVALGDGNSTVWRWAAVEVAGLGIVALGVANYRGDYRLVGVGVAVIGLAACVGALIGFTTGIERLSESLRLLPGFVGLGVLASALLPVRGDGSRGLVTAGAAFVFSCVILTGLFQTADLPLLLGTTVGAVVAWDAGRHAIGVGEQLGSRASTWRCELPHIGATALVGTVGAFAVVGVRNIVTQGLSLPSFALVFVAMVLLTVALRW